MSSQIIIGQINQKVYEDVNSIVFQIGCTDKLSSISLILGNDRLKPK